MSSLLPILPPSLCLAAVLACLVAGDRTRALALVGMVAQLALLGIGFVLFAHAQEDTLLVHPLGGWQAPVGIVFVADRLAALLLLLVLVVFSAATVYFFLDREPRSRASALALIFLLEMGIVGGLLTGDLFDFYVFFELMGLASYGLVGYRRSPAHVEAAIKYAALSLAGSTLMLLGVGAIYAQTGTLAFAGLQEASEVVRSRPLFLFAVALVLVSLCLKCALVPLHFWLPDAHSIAPTAVSVLLSGTVVKLGLYGIVRLLGSNAPWVWTAVGTVLLPIGALTAVIAALAAVSQRDLKRLLAWSTASQMGYIVAAAALGSSAGVAAALTHAVAHALMKSTLFLGAGAAIGASGERRWDRMGGLLACSPLLAAALLVAFLSLAGIPPLAGFSGKLAIFAALIEARAWVTLLCLLFASALMIYLAVRIWLALFGGKPAFPPTRPPAAKVAVVGVMALFVVIAGLATGPLLLVARAAAADLFLGEAYRSAVLGLPTSTEVLP